MLCSTIKDWVIILQFAFGLLHPDQNHLCNVKNAFHCDIFKTTGVPWNVPFKTQAGKVDKQLELVDKVSDQPLNIRNKNNCIDSSRS